jgi:hypothetical protein
MMNFRVEGYTGPLNEADAVSFVRPFFADGVSIDISAMIGEDVDVTDLSEQPGTRTLRGAAAIVGTVTLPR